MKRLVYPILMTAYFLLAFQKQDDKIVIFYANSDNEMVRDHYNFYFRDYKDFLANHDIGYATVHNMDTLINMIPKAPDSTVTKLRNRADRGFLMVLKDGRRIEINKTFGTRRDLKFVIKRFYGLLKD